MKVKSIPSRWLSEEGRRFDCGPYMSGAREAKAVLARLAMRKDKLQELTAGGMAGIVNAGRIKRQWVDDPAYGIPFLSSSDILQADLSSLPLISKRVVAENPQLLLEPGWTLITRSGTIGRMAYTRPDMGGMGCSEHVMRVQPDANRVPSGYLYAYLSSKFGVPLIVSGTYGSIIQSIEPHHIANLPVPRLGEELEQRVHALVDEAARLRTEAANIIFGAIEHFEKEDNLPHLNSMTSAMPFSISSVPSSLLQKRLDGFFHSNYHNFIIEKLETAKFPMLPVRDICDSVIEPPRFKRIAIPDTKYGIPFFGTTALTWNNPVPNYFLSKSMPGIHFYKVSTSDLLIPRSGQVSGIIGTVLAPIGGVVDGAVTEDAIRIRCIDESTAGFLYVALSSQYGLRQLKARAYGSSIPHLDIHQVGSVLIPTFPDQIKTEIGQSGAKARELRHKAILTEALAQSIVEQAIEEAA